MRRPVSHLLRDFALMLGAVLALTVAGWIAVGYGFALAIAMVTGVAAIMVIPFVGIYYEERDLPKDGRPRGT